MMIKQLRWKFVLLSMSLVTAVLLTVFAVIVISSIRQAEDATDRILTEALESYQSGQNDGIPGIEKRHGGLGQRWGITQPGLPVFLVELDEDGEIASTQLRNVTISDEVLEEAAEEALESEKSSGRIREYGLKFAMRYTSCGTIAAFVDVSASDGQIRQQIFSSLIVGFFGLGAFFSISLFLANWALRPVEAAWIRQKQFVADASHELKTPLTVILANMNILLAHPEETIRQQSRWIENTRTEGLRMKGLVEDMLFLARADMAVKPQMESFSLSDAVWGAALPFESVAFEANVTVETAVADQMIITGNEGMIRQLVAILMDNGIKYAGEGGRVCLRLAGQGDRIRLSVNNTGKPIEPEELPHVFERFYRAEASRTRKTGGYGLGLAIAQSIATQNHAQISVTSSQTEGTTFLVEWRNR